MIHRILSWLKRPFPLLQTPSDKLLVSLVSGVIVIAILTVLRPFGINQSKDIFPYLLGFGIIDFLFTAVNLFLIPFLLPGVIKDNKWNTGKNLLFISWLLLNISIINFFYSEYMASEIDVDGLIKLNRSGILSWIAMTFSVGIIPVVFALYFIEKRLFSANSRLAENLSKNISKKHTSKAGRKIELNSGKYDAFAINSNDLICVKAEGGNYATIFWKEESGIKKEMLRLTLIGFLEVSQNIEGIERCHKSFIINLNKVNSSYGNARSIFIKLDGLDFDVPISRSFPREKLIAKSH